MGQGASGRNETAGGFGLREQECVGAMLYPGFTHCWGTREAPWDAKDGARPGSKVLRLKCLLQSWSILLVPKASNLRRIS